VGTAVRRARERSDAEARRAELEHELGRQRAEHAVAVERARIARELHDVVASALSICVLQARGGRKVLRNDHRAAEEALTTIETTAEQALGEMRRLVGLLRTEAADPLPQPSLRHLDELVARTVSSGLRTDLVVEGDLDRLPPGLDVTAYRIVQESLTNVLEHADARHVTVQVTVTEDALGVEVVDDGRGGRDGGPPKDRSGNGLVGMRERATLFGGELDAGALPDGGFAVRARLPLPAPST
jgi:signal transduction histidine kinase